MTSRSAFASVETDSGPDGTFSIRRLAPSTSVTVQASKAGFAPARRTGIRLKTGEAVRGVSLVLRRGVEAQGTVVDADGHPVAGAEVRAARVEKGRRGFAMMLAGSRARKARTPSRTRRVFSASGVSKPAATA